MARPPERTPEQIRREIEVERDQLASSVDALKAGISSATDIAGKLRPHVPVIAAAAFGAGFVLWGGVGATMRLLARRSREGETALKLGPFSVVDHR